MPKFKIMTPVPNWEGGVGDGATATRFVNGCAELDVTDQTTASRLAYFRSAGYGIEALDDVSAGDAIRQAVLTPEQEHAELLREKATLKQATELDDLRAEVRELRAQADVEKRKSQEEPDVEVPADEPPPADTASVGDWREYGVRSLDLSEHQAMSMTKAQLQQRARERARKDGVS